MNAFGLLPSWGEMTSAGRAPVALLLLAFLVTFALTRLYTRLARVRGWGSGSVGGIHLHHMVIGIIIVLVVGLVEIAVRPDGLGHGLLAIAFGAGAALTLDEFALWLYLRDVYWCPEGRSSIDAMVMGVVLSGLLLVGTAPFGIQGGGSSRLIAFAMLSFDVLLAIATFLKGKLWLGMLSVFVPLVGLVAAIRLAKPNSLWAKWLYRHGPKHKRATRRFDEGQQWLRRARDRFDDLVGGAPSFAREMETALEIVSGRISVRR